MSSIAALQAEIDRLIALLEAHHIEWRIPPTPPAPPPNSSYSSSEKIALFRRLFRGRNDVFPVRWYSKSSGRSGYSPACSNEWKKGICHKPNVKCGDCTQRVLTPLSDEVVYGHLIGQHTIGVYPLLPDNSCYFLAVDFDDEDWRADSVAFVTSCQELGVPAALEISRSGQGAHAWIFFAQAVNARDARRLGAALISATCARTRQLKLRSYDRLFPNQDSMPDGGFGNLIALPLQRQPREHGFSVFVDLQLQPYPDQWQYLATLQSMVLQDIEPTIFRATGHSHPLDVAFVEAEDLATPWQKSSTNKLNVTLSTPLNITLANAIYFEKAQLPQPLANRLIRLAAFQNPEFYKLQAMRKSVWDTPRVIGSAENFPQHIALPRGCLDAVLDLLQTHQIAYELQDKRNTGTAIDVQFIGQLRLDQELAVTGMLQHDIGVLCAPTAFGKTVTAAAFIARRAVNTLILVHRAELLKQWQERLHTFLGIDKQMLGTLSGGKNKTTGKIDIALMQSLSRKEDAQQLIENYGLIIVDECHHIGAESFEALLKQAPAKYVLGLTATPIRRDGLQPLIFMQCGPTRYTASKPAGAPQILEIQAITHHSTANWPAEVRIQEIFQQLVQDEQRNTRIVNEIIQAHQKGRQVLVLTERTEHITLLQTQLAATINSEALFVLHGRLSSKQRNAVLAQLAALPAQTARVILATGKLVGEGFDHPVLDTLILAMPISWKGTLQQYAGRLHREHVDKTTVQIIDIVDDSHPMLLKMWQKRQLGYKAMGYRVVETFS